MENSKIDRIKHKKVANLSKTEKQYLKGMVNNLSLQRLSDQEIVNYLHDEKSIDIARSTINAMRNQTERKAGKWYLELRQSGTKYIAIYKERLDSLMSYQRKLNQIVDAYLRPPNDILYTDTVVRAISELHRIEMSLYTLFKETPVLEITPDNKDINAIKKCRCTDIITHCRCRHCKEVWCPTEKGQDWCPNPDCTSGLKGCEFKPWDEKRDWVQCVCRRWFKLPEIMERHRSLNCTVSNLPPAIE